MTSAANRRPVPPPDLVIGYCTHAIQSGRLSNDALIAAFASRALAYAREGNYDSVIADFSQIIRLNPQIAQAYYDRGLGYKKKGDYGHAIADYTQAIRLDPDLSQAFYNRANAYSSEGEYALALADYDRAIELNPDDSMNFLGRGGIRFLRGEYGPAATDFVRAVQLAPENAYAALWLHLAQIRAGRHVQDDLVQKAQQMDPKLWPGPVVNLYLGKAKAATVLEAAGDAASGQKKSRECQAHFFIAEYRLEQGRKDEAVHEFREALAVCSRSDGEYGIAKVELGRLGN